MIESKILESMDENKLFNYMKNYFADIIDLNIEDQMAPIDWYVPSMNLHIEAKCRKEVFATYFIQKEKYDELFKVEKCWYLNSTPKGIYYWDLDQLKDLFFYERNMAKTQQFGEPIRVRKLVADLRIKDAMEITHLILELF